MTRKIRRRGPIVLPGRPMPKALRKPVAHDALSVDELEAPLPGPILVQLSRLHRTVSSKRDDKGSA